jgi:hypothetical protein
MDAAASIRTEANLRNALQSGLLDEGDHLDFKRELTAGDRGTKATAIDLASLAIEGGMIVVGVTPGRPPDLAPVALDGQRERVEQIARQRIDPPLRVEVREIPTEDSLEEGYLVLTVPASSQAPHAVDRVFRGRHGTTNVQLTASEVRAIHERQRPDPLAIDDEMAQFTARDPFPPERQALGRLYIIARPLAATPQMLERSVGSHWARWTEQNVRSGPALRHGFSPDFQEAWQVRRMPDGWIASHFETPHRAAASDSEKHGIEVELAEDGTVRVFCSRPTDYLDHQKYVVLEAVILGLVLRTIRLAATVGRDAGYAGDWQLSLVVTRLKDAVSLFLTQNLFIDARDPMPYPDERYQRTWRGSAINLVDEAAVADALVGGLNRTLNEGRFETALVG